jgi:hypothetical protein
MIVAVGEVTVPRRRGPNRAAPWRWDGPVSVLRLPLDVHDPHVRRHVERLFAAGYAVRRAVQRDARSRVAAYWAAHHERPRKWETFRLAATIAAHIVAVHGAKLVVEDCDLRAWARRWGRGIHAFTPGTLITALRHETAAVVAVSGGPGLGLMRAGTRHTAWTQHCLCGARVAKGLGQRRHNCSGCGLAGDRDLVAALLGAHTTLTDPAVPGPARIDWPTAHTTLHTCGVQAINEGLQGALPSQPEPTAPTRRPTVPGCGGRSAAPATPNRVAGAGVLGEVPVRADTTPAPGDRRPVPPTTPDETRPAPPDATTPERRGAHPGLRHNPGTQPRAMKADLNVRCP